MNKFKFFASSLCLAAFLFVPVPSMHAQANNATMQAHVEKALHAKRFHNVHVSIQNGTATLSGTVKYFADKVDAQKKVKKADRNLQIENTIQVQGREVSNEKLAQKLNEEINNSRVGYGTTAFNAISAQVHGDAVVTLSGFAYGPVDANTAFNIAANMAGVKDVINQIHVDPPSPQDDRIRRMAYRAIYGAAQLNKYAINPVKPIRIQVEGGHITLYGTVDSLSDKEVAGIRANTVPGVFSVKNNLQVAGGEQ